MKNIVNEIDNLYFSLAEKYDTAKAIQQELLNSEDTLRDATEGVLSRAEAMCKHFSNLLEVLHLLKEDIEEVKKNNDKFLQSLANALLDDVMMQVTNDMREHSISKGMFDSVAHAEVFGEELDIDGSAQMDMQVSWLCTKYGEVNCKVGNVSCEYTLDGFHYLQLPKDDCRILAEKINDLLKKDLIYMQL